MTRVLSPGSDEQWRAFDAEAQMLARALRTGRFTVLVGALGVGKTRLLVDGLLPLLSRRIGDEPRRPGVALQVVVPVPDRRSRAPGRDRGELLYFVDQRDGVPSDSQVRARAELPAGAQVHFDLAESISPAHLSALSQQHAGAHLLFVFDHFESVLEGAQHSPDMQRFVDAWAKAVQTPDLNVHFLVALDEHVWLRLLALRANLPDVELRAFHLQTRDGRQVLESLPENQPLGGDAKTELSAADFMASINARLSEVTKSTREATSGPEDFNASLNAAMSRVFRLARPVKPSPISEPSPAKRQSIVEGQGANRVRPAATVVAPAPAPQSGGAARETLATAGQGAMALEATEAEGKLVAARRAEAQRAREAEIRQRESREAAERAAADRAAEAARETQARQNAEAAAKAVAAERRVEAARRAVAERDAEAARQVEAARVGEARRLAQALAAAEAAVAREVHSRQIAEALAKAAQTERRVESERSAEAVRQAEAARWAESQKLAQALAAAEAVAAREVRARQIAEAAAKAAQAERRAEQEAVLAAAQAVARRATEGRLRTQEQLVVSAAAKSGDKPITADAAAGLRRTTAGAAGPLRTGLLLATAVLAAVLVVVLWWPTHSPPPAVSAASPTVAAAPASPEVAAPPHTSDSASSLESTSAAEPAPARSGRYEVLAAGGDGSSGRIARELAGALSTDPAAMRVAPLGAGTDPISWVQAPGRLAIVRFDALRLARGGSAPLRVLTPLFPEEVLFIVRADSPLKYIHELKGRRLSIGPTEGDGSKTVREIYRRLFDAEVNEPTQLDNDRALAELVAFRSIDAMAIVEPLPSAWWASLDQRTARGLRLLSLDLRYPMDRKLLQAVGTSVVRAGAGATRAERTTTPAVMSFLVASGEGDADVDRLTAMARALCRELPRLRAHGHPKWRELKAAAQLDTGWPVVRPVQSVLSRCAPR